MIPAEPLCLEELCKRVHDSIAAFLDDHVLEPGVKRVQEQTKTALGVIDDALERYTLPQLSLSYNGGKDCLVLLVLFLSALHTHHLRRCPPSPSSSSSSSSPQPCAHFSPIQSVYIQSPHPFAEVETFVRRSEVLYTLSLQRYRTASMKSAFAQYLTDHPTVRAIFVGTRRTDPHGAQLTHFDPTDGGWPPFMRCHPVVDWRYADVWTFLRRLRVPYCELYDFGYTSLGGTTDTVPNPALRVEGVDGAGARYRPAYELVGDAEERLGRESKAIDAFKS